MSQNYTKFNVNHNIKVKLNDLGYQLLADQHNSYKDKIPNWTLVDMYHYKNMADSEGYTKFQMWSFMRKFGSVCVAGGPEYYDLDILIDID